MPVNPSEGRQPQLFNGFPGPWVLRSAHEFLLVMSVDCFHQRVIKTVADSPDGGDSNNLGEATTILFRRKLAAGIRLTP